MIFHFSGTGNTRWAAQRLATAIHEDLINIASYMRADDSSHDIAEPFTLKEDERLGFVFPVHGWRVPRLVREFIKRVKIQKENSSDKTSPDKDFQQRPPFTYCVCTAGDNIGLTIDNLNDTIVKNPSLLRLGIQKVSSSYSLIMPESYVGLPFMDVDTKENEIRKKEEAAQELAIVCEEVFNRKEGISRLVKGPCPWFLTKVVGGFFENVLISDKRFHVEKDRCVKCGICANVCPVGDIKGGHGEYPKWLHHKDCLTCFNCYHHCPHHAIEFGHQTQKKGQYYFK